MLVHNGTPQNCCTAGLKNDSTVSPVAMIAGHRQASGRDPGEKADRAACSSSVPTLYEEKNSGQEEKLVVGCNGGDDQKVGGQHQRRGPAKQFVCRQSLSRPPAHYCHRQGRRRRPAGFPAPESPVRRAGRDGGCIRDTRSSRRRTRGSIREATLLPRPSGSAVYRKRGDEFPPEKDPPSKPTT